MEDNKQEEVKKEDNNKIDQQFTSNLKKLVGMFKGEKAFNTSKLPNSDLNDVIEELLMERKKLKLEEFKRKASSLLDKKVEFDKFLIQKEKDLKDAITNKKKEFIKEMNDCFGLVESIDKMSKDYYTSINEVKNQTEVAEIPSENKTQQD